MKYISRIFLTLAALMATVVAPACSGDDDAMDLYSMGMPRLELADPFIMLVDTTYFAYGTHDSGNGFHLYTSTNLVEWRERPGYILHKDNVWGERQFWAPEVYWIAQLGKYVMYYSAEEHLCCATADTPFGPFVQSGSGPMLPDKNIDPNLLFMPDSTAYIYYAKTTVSNAIWCARLAEDFQSIVPGSETLCIQQSQPWEVHTINEGPEVMYHRGRYYMMYSGNGYTYPKYGVGIATASSPTGPWTKSDRNPILCCPVIHDVRFEGSGHNCYFRDRDGVIRTAFHVHSAPGKPDPRFVIIATLAMPNTVNDIITITDDYIAPYVIAD